MKKYIIYGVLASLIVLVFYIWDINKSYSPSSPTNGTSLEVTSTSTATTTFSMADVKNHADGNSCYSAVNGSVYDLTSWIGKHPGGKAAILMICGKDGSTLFNTTHGGSKKIGNILAKYKIGTLAN